MLKTLKAEGHLGSFSGSSSQGMSSSQCRDEVALPRNRFVLKQQTDAKPSGTLSLDDSFPMPLPQTCHGYSFQGQIPKCLDIADGRLTHIPAQIHASSKPTELPPSNLFQSGFQDCATEVIRFLEDQEKMDVQSPLLQGLRSHLVSVSKSLSDNGQSHSSTSTSLSPDMKRKELTHTCHQSVPLSLRSSSPVFSASVEDSLPGHLNNEMPTTLLYSMSERSQETPLLSGRKRSSDASFLSSSSSNLSPSSSLSQKDDSFPTSAKRSRYTLEPIPALSHLPNEACEEKPSVLESNTLLARCEHSQLLCEPESSMSALPPFLLSKPSLVIDLSRSTPLTFHPALENISDLQSKPSTSSLLSSSSSSAETTMADTAILTSDNIDDVLSSVESCRYHEDPRVRTLAARIINLIHDVDEEEEYEEIDEEEEEDCFDDDIENERDCEENHHDLEDSGIDLEVEED